MCVYLCAYTIINVHLVFIYVHVYPVIIKEHYVHVLFIVNVDIYVRFYVLICVFRNPVNTVLFSPHVILAILQKQTTRRYFAHF